MTEPVDLEAERELRELREIDRDQERWEVGRPPVSPLQRLQTPPISRSAASGP